MDIDPKRDPIPNMAPEPDLTSIEERLSRLEGQQQHDLAQLRQELRRFGLLLALATLLVGIMLGGGGAYLLLRNPAVDGSQRSSPAAARCPGLDHPLAGNSDAVAKIQTRLDGGEKILPQTAVAKNGPLEIVIKSVMQIEDRLRVVGRVRNVGDQPLVVPLSAFRFCDQSGTVYAVLGETQATLQPDEGIDLDLTVPISRPVGLALMVELPDGKASARMILIGSEATPEP